ncbi:hypothetical protein ACOME3_002160 [Neoechinorhynchus agilis]
MYSAIVGSTKWLLGGGTNREKSEEQHHSVPDLKENDNVTVTSETEENSDRYRKHDENERVASEMDAVLLRLDRLANQIEAALSQFKTPEAKTNNQIVGENRAKFVDQVDKACEEFLKQNDAINSIDGFEVLKEAGKHVQKMVDFQRTFITDFVVKYEKPKSNEQLLPLLEPLQKSIEHVEQLKQKCKPKQGAFDHVQAIADAASIFGWFTCEQSAMVNYMIEMMRASEFYTNRILSAQKSSEYLAKHQMWITSWLKLLKSLISFVEENFAEQPMWLGNEVISALSPTSPPIPLVKRPTPKVTSGSAKKEPSMRIEHNRKTVEYYVDRHDPPIEINIDEMKHSAYLFKCKNATFKVSGKMNTLTIDSCEQVAIIVQSTIVSSLDCINCKSVQVQTTAQLPTVSVDKTDGFQLYLSAKYMICDIYSSMSNGITINRPKEVEDGSVDYEEYGVPHQILTKCNEKGEISSVAHGGLF